MFMLFVVEDKSQLSELEKKNKRLYLKGKHQLGFYGLL